MLGNKTYLTLCSILALKSLHVTCFTSFPPPNAFAKNTVTTKLQMRKNEQHEDTFKRSLAAISASLVISSSLLFGNAYAATPASEAAKYDGFGDYAKENQMEKSDVGCFFNKCGDQTKALFSNPRGIKGATCLGRCKGEQSCATRCFAEFGSEDLNNWLSCTIEDNECVKVPKKR